VSWRGVATALLGSALVLGCKCGTSSSATTDAAKPLEPLVADSWLVELPLTGFGVAVAAVPLGASEPRPVVIALHGGADRPEWQCGTWTGIFQSRAFVLCPRGVARGDRFGWGSPEATQKELRAALSALKQRFPGHVDKGSVVLTAFGAGTRHATEIARQEPEFFQKLVLVGVEPDIWSAGQAGAYAKRGGQRVMFVCSDAKCDEWASRYFVFSRGAGAYSKVVNAGAFGRLLDARVADAIRKETPWLVQGDARFGPLGEKD
jgi:pimeloyl-ACP methyl ester carboxylesterase